MSPFSKYACAKSIRMCVCCRARFPQKELYRFLVESSLANATNNADNERNAQKIIKPFSLENLFSFDDSQKRKNGNTKNDKKNSAKKGQKGIKRGKSFYFCKECLSACLADEKQLTKAFARAIKGLPKNLGEIQEMAQEWLTKSN